MGVSLVLECISFIISALPEFFAELSDWFVDGISFLGIVFVIIIFTYIIESLMFTH